MGILYKTIAPGLEFRQVDGSYTVKKLIKGPSDIGGTWHVLQFSKNELERIFKELEENTDE